MLALITEILNCSNVKIENGTLFCNNYIVDDINKITLLEDDGLLESSIGTVQKGLSINLELTLAKLHQYGFYENCDTFVSKNQYRVPAGDYYIYELNSNCFNRSVFMANHIQIVKLINAIESISKHIYNDAGTINSILFREDKTAYLPIKYSAIDVNSIRNTNSLESISSESRYRPIACSDSDQRGFPWCYDDGAYRERYELFERMEQINAFR
jgi:hypothetical protein